MEQFQTIDIQKIKINLHHDLSSTVLPLAWVLMENLIIQIPFFLLGFGYITMLLNRINLNLKRIEKILSS